jgi:hypothetical protein
MKVIWTLILQKKKKDKSWLEIFFIRFVLIF